MRIQTILDQIDLGMLALPEFQRGYVWNRAQVRDLMSSLYRRYPIGGLLVWVTRTDGIEIRGATNAVHHTVELLLDGQQRITTLYGVVRGKPPEFFQGNAQAFDGLYFHLEDEVFEFYGPVKMKDQPLWISVTDLLKHGVGEYIQRLLPLASDDRLPIYIDRLNSLCGIVDIELHIDKVTGSDKNIDIVVDIFNRVNSGGTKLSQGDLALARICAQWPGARDALRTRIANWAKAGFSFRQELLLRCVNTILTGEAKFAALEREGAASIKEGLERAGKWVDYLLNVIASRLGLDHDRVLGGPQSLPLMVRYVDQRSGHLSQAERDRLLYWYVHSFLWGRYAGATETALNQDLEAIAEGDRALDRLVDNLRRQRGDLRIRPVDFIGFRRDARFYPLLYMLTRVWKALDWDSAVPLSFGSLGAASVLQLHHIFPKSRLYELGYEVSQVNALANFTFLTQETNLMLSNRDPAEYLPEFESKHPGVLASHWIPSDPDLWRSERYADFLAARRELLAEAANAFLDSLLAGTIPDQPAVAVVDRVREAVPGSVASEDEEQQLFAVCRWMVQHGLPEGELMWELTDRDTGQLLAVLDLAWPNGLQEGLSAPVALLLDEPQETMDRANRAGFRYFTDVAGLQDYVREQVLSAGSAVT